VARDVFHVILAAVEGMTTAVPSLHRERSVMLGARTGLRKGEHRKGRANHMVLVVVQRDGADGALEPGQLSSPFPEHEPGEQASRAALSRDRQGGIEWNACGPAAIRHHEIRQAQARPAYDLARGAERDQRQYRQSAESMQVTRIPLWYGHNSPFRLPRSSLSGPA
jgi:hypothetical protein